MITSEYKHNGTGKRVQGIENGATTKYLYDGLSVIIERNGLDNTLVTYTRGLSYGGGIGGIISRTTQDAQLTAHYYHYDGLGTVTGLTDLTGQTVQTYTYDAYGNLLATSGTETNPYLFSTKELSSKSGLNYFGARYYDSKVGRWITKDPLTWGPDDPRIFSNPLMPQTFIQVATILQKGVLSSDLYTATPVTYREFQKTIINHMGEINHLLFHRYVYCFNNPTNWIDPYGLTPWWKKWYIDIGWNGSVIPPGTLGAGGTLGLMVGPTGIYFYYGFGLGGGGGVSATFNPAQVPSSGVDVTLAGRGGWEIGAQGTVSLTTGDFGGGIGAGLGAGVSVTATHTITIIGGGEQK